MTLIHRGKMGLLRFAKILATRMNSKQCFKCNEVKNIELFHRHPRMKDGRLNKCSACVVRDVNEWRLKNPGVRHKEYLKRKPKLGITRTQQEYIEEKRKTSKGRRAVLLEYTTKRRMSLMQQTLTELDDLVQKEAVHLCELRKKVTGIDWHVDHIVPLHHKQACGLHNAFNLQVVPGSWNISKGNRNMDIYFARH